MANKNEIQGDERLENVENALSKTELWIEEHQKPIWIAIAAIVLVVVIVFGVKKFYIEPRNEKANSEIFTAQKLFEKESYEAALNGDGNYLGFNEIISQYGNTKAGKLANYYAGISSMKLGNYTDAIDYLKKFNGKDEILAPMALGAIGDCYMELDDMNSAADYYTKAANKSKNDFTAPMFLTKAGMTYEIMGDNAKALNCYKTLKADFPMSNEAFEISKNIANLEAKMK